MRGGGQCCTRGGAGQATGASLALSSTLIRQGYWVAASSVVVVVVYKREGLRDQ